MGRRARQGPVAEALPLWTASQATVRERLGSEAEALLIETLQKVEQLDT